MNGRSLLALAVIGFVSAGLAGCIDAPSFNASTDTEVTAKEYRDLADNAAAAWNPDARLVGVFSAELVDNMSQEIPLDPNPGDGRTLLWIYAYATPDGAQSRAFQVSADGEVVAKDEHAADTQEYATSIQPLEGWNVDSDAAIGTARSNDTFRLATEAENASYFLGLGMLGEMGMGAVWAIAVGTQESITYALVDATGGELVMVQTFPVQAPTPLPILDQTPMETTPAPVSFHVEDSGRLSASESRREYPFHMNADAQTAFIQIEMTDRDLPTDGLRWTLYDQEENIVANGNVNSYNPMMTVSMASTVFELGEAGDYNLVVTYRSSTGFLPVGSANFNLLFHAGPGAEEMGEEAP